MKSFDDHISAQDLLGQYTHMHNTSLITISSFVSCQDDRMGAGQIEDNFSPKNKAATTEVLV